MIILASLESSDRKLSIHIRFSKFGYHFISQFHDFDQDLHFRNFMFINFQ